MMKKVIVVILCCLLACAIAYSGDEIADPIFDFDAIFNDALDARVLSSKEVKDELTRGVTVVIEEVEYTAEIYHGKPVRIYGILAYPKGFTDLPGVYWSQSGMYAASDYWAKVWAGKGYFCMHVTLPHDVYSSFARFTTERPEDGNLTHLAVAQMRGITYMTQRPEVDKERIGTGGSSYGGFFSALIAGADPRVKCGMSFFTSGNHRLGSVFPQFRSLDTAEEADIWSKTIDPAWRLRRKAVPFLWAVASNDTSVHLYASIQTYQDSIGDKRLAIAPNWSHAFPENIDNELIDWFDVYLMKTRKPYNQPSAMEVKTVNGKLTASWTWSGSNRVNKAEVVVCYGSTRCPEGWLYRYNYAIPARIRGNGASVEIPVPEQGIEMLVYGNITDERDVVTSTAPLPVKTAGMKITPLELNAALLSEFTPDEMLFFARHGMGVAGTVDKEERHNGGESLRMEAGKPLSLKLGHIPEHSHVLTLWLRTAQPAKVKVTVTANAPFGWGTANLASEPKIAYGDSKPPVYSDEFETGQAWKQFTLDCRYNGAPVEGYTLAIAGEATCWADTIKFQPRWESARAIYITPR